MDPKSSRGRDGQAAVPEIVLSDVSKSYVDATGRHVTVIDNMNLTFRPGEFACILGPSGCGKSTLLNLIAGLERPTAGSIRLGSEQIKGPAPERGMVFQQFALFPWLNVIKNVEFGLRLQGLSPSARRERAMHYLKLVGLDHVSHALPKELSGGMKQRCALARAYAVDPAVLLMDEPFGALDALSRSQLQEDLLGMKSAEQRTIVFITHDVDEAAYLGDRIIVLARHGGAVTFDVHPELDRGLGESLRSSAQYQELREELWRHVHA